MGLVSKLVTLPLLGGPRLVYWVAKTVGEEAERQMLDEGPLRGSLIELQQKYDAGDLDDEEYDLQERAVLERLKIIREFKARQGAQ